MSTEDICDMYEQETGVVVERNYASSGTLARQIANGANADVFVSANNQWIEFLKEKKLLKPGSIRVVARNALVVIAPKDATVGPIGFTKDFDLSRAAEHIAVGNPAYVPVGKYTDEMFRKLKWKDRLQGMLILAKDVSSVLNYVAMGECELGIVYRSEAMLSSKVKVVAHVPETLHSPIRFFVAEIKQSTAPEQSQALSDLFIKKGAAVFRKYGFSLPRSR